MTFCNSFLLDARPLSTHILTRRMTFDICDFEQLIFLSTHILTRRMTSFHFSTSSIMSFNSHPHKEDDCSMFCTSLSVNSFNSHPHKEDDASSACSCQQMHGLSTHILTRRMTAILNKNTLSKTARIIPFEYNTLKIYIFSNSYLLFFWKSTPFSGANLQEDFCALIIRTKISKYP
mgnify:CR=1 FL=1